MAISFYKFRGGAAFAGSGQDLLDQNIRVAAFTGAAADAE